MYKFAEMFVFPSEYEGFGIPVLESYKMNCPTILNSNDCFREITFNNGTFFEMNENDSNLSEVMERTLFLSKEEKEQMLSIQKDILSHHSLDKMANNIKTMFTKVIGK